MRKQKTTLHGAAEFTTRSFLDLQRILTIWSKLISFLRMRIKVIISRKENQKRRILSQMVSKNIHIEVFFMFCTRRKKFFDGNRKSYTLTFLPAAKLFRPYSKLTMAGKCYSFPLQEK
jgi:hypothetical protein